MKFCEATFAKREETETCKDLAVNMARFIMDDKTYIYYLCDFHTEILKQAEPNLEVEGIKI